MRRRDFVKGLTLGSAAGAVLPSLGCASPSGAAAKNVEKRDKHGSLVETFKASCAARSGMALGGIGAGTIELRKDGVFYNWNIFNNFPKETGPKFFIEPSEEEDAMSSLLFFKVRYQTEGEAPKIKLLNLNQELTEGGITGTIYYFPWMEAVQNIEYGARFPFATLKFTDADMPFDIEMTAWTPFIPHDTKNSSLPMAYFDFTIKAKPVKNRCYAGGHRTQHSRLRPRRQVLFRKQGARQRSLCLHSICGWLQHVGLYRGRACAVLEQCRYQLLFWLGQPPPLLRAGNTQQGTAKY
ncbi:MAG: hypothetical protein HC896_01355 [Bacteroidales bacterium]|nr:hypothetical protein [Bacteroidales bacterium]